MNDATAKCRYFGTCAGCTRQHQLQTEQTAAKQQYLLDKLTADSVVAEEVLPVMYGDSWHYRNKARLSVKQVVKKNKVLIGFRERKGRFVADMDFCHILHKKPASLIVPLQQLIAKLKIAASIPQLEIAVDDDVVAIVIRHLQPVVESDMQLLVDFAKEYNICLYLQAAGVDSTYKIWPQNEDLLSYNLFDFKLKLFFHPHDFVQINMQMNRRMIAKAIELLAVNNHDRVLDLFCGIGNFSLPIATLAKEVVGVELLPSAVDRACYNAKYNHINNASFVAVDLYKGLQKWCYGSFNKVVLDPPRSGMPDINLLLKLAPEKILYISCNQDSFAKDAKQLIVSKQYRLQKLQLVDLFPHTEHIETMGLFTKI